MVWDATFMRVRVAAAVTILLLLIAGVGSICFAWSDLLRTSGNLAELQKASRLVPFDSRPLLRQASLIGAENPTGREDEAILQRAVTLNPRDTEAWMALGLKAELSGDKELAEKRLLHAAELDHTFKPAWTLANFYVRADEIEKFWQWIRTCIDLVEPRNAEFLTFDPRPMFALCWNVTDDASLIMERAVPPKHFVLHAYLSYLLSTQRFEAALKAARILFPMAEPSDYDSLLSLCNSLTGEKEAAAAVEVWNAMAAKKLFALSPLRPGEGLSLTNGDLRSPPTGYAFDWRILRPRGVYDRYSATAPDLQFEFDGEEQEHCEILAQVVPLLRSRKYRFTYRYQTSGLAGAETGLSWSLATEGKGPIAARDQKGEGSFVFVAPVDREMPLLILSYDRLAGTVKIKGSIKLIQARLDLLP
jgi:tetratricopeptide (TPR) repeat protein